MDLEPTEPTTAKVPRSIIVLIVIWTLVGIVIYLIRPSPSFEQDTYFAVIEILQLLYSFLVVALVGYGLVKGLRFVWVAAFVWQALEAGFGGAMLTMSPFEIDSYMSGVPFYRVTLPITVAIVSYVLLLLPSTRRWVQAR